MTASRVWAVFSTFRPDDALLDSVASVAAQVDHVVIVDDGSGAVADDVLSRISSPGVKIVRRQSNDGIAAALNDGIARGCAAGADYVITFDQDSNAPDGFVSGLVRVAEQCARAGERVGVVVPEYFADVRQQRGPKARIGDATNVIQSGMLIPATVIRAVGALREDYFIDLVDTEFELRLRRHGYSVLAVGGLRLEHALGTRYQRQLFGLTMRLPRIPPEITLSTPFRYFYRVRNRIVLNREYLLTAPRQIARDTVLDLIHFVNAVSVARPRRSLLRLYGAAVAAAFSGRLGRMPSALMPVAGRVRWNAPVVVSEDR
ncbi:hypothetical protein CW368_04175 [Actinomycetales bacterium SN12]|nr:hypothetical protein CW368_04175 [Actinomycetales bacterium SN12]